MSDNASRATFPPFVPSVPGTIVVALGGNALSPPGERVTIQDQFRHTRSSLGTVVELVETGWGVIIVHGNGPQVGQALTRNELARDLVEPLPLGVLVAATAGWIGYMIQQSLQNALIRTGIEREVLTVVTQTVVSEHDPALRKPSKPIGNVLSPERAQRLSSLGIAVGKDGSGRVRRLAPSPRPIEVAESQAVQRLVAEGVIVIAAGGGGPPVQRTVESALEGLDAVVDKDLTAAVLGVAVGASTLLILTDVDAVYRAWGTAHALPIRSVGVGQARTLVAEGEVGVGSMAPKLEAAALFVEGGGQRAVIGHLAQGSAALAGESGTTVKREEI